MLLGLARKEISPKFPVPLAGFGHRQGLSDKLAHPLYVRVAAFKDEQSCFLLINADMIYWGEDNWLRLKKLCAEHFSDWQILAHASHTHSAPQPSFCYAPSLGAADPRWLEDFFKTVQITIEKAIADLQVLSGLEYAQGFCDFAINRRKKGRSGNIIMAPNYQGVHSRLVHVVKLLGESSHLRALFLHYPCHPTTMGNNDISAEFPGVACQQLEGLADEVFFLQGFCGEQRPALIQGDRFFRGDAKDIDYLGGVLADEVKDILKKPQKQLALGDICVKMSAQQLAFAEGKNKEELSKMAENSPLNSIESQWSKAMLKGLAVQPEFRLQAISLGDFLLLTTNAEMVYPYQDMFTKLFPHKLTLTLGYSNGMIGYVPTKTYLEEGGYEAITSHPYFFLQAPYSKDVEKQIFSQAQNLAESFMPALN